MSAAVRELRASVVQCQAIPSDKRGNLAILRRLASAAAAEGSKLVVFPEMCLVAYWHLTKATTEHLRRLAEPADGFLVTSLKQMAADLDIAIGAGFLEADGEQLFNSYAVCFPDGAVHVHRKLHAFEHEAVSSGGAYTVFDTPWGVRMAILICWDNNLIENVRAVTLLGAKVLIAPHQTGGTSSRSPHGMKVIPSELWHNRVHDPAALLDAVNGPDGRGWLMRWLPARAHDNGIFLLFSNGIGPDDDEIRTGNAMVLDPYGRIVAETPVADEAVVTADLDLDLLPLSTGRRWLLGRRPELYGVLTERSGLERDARTARHSDVPVPDDFRIGS
ncbi:nitrilase-related carbon-nitrogen hydrolase [Agromyces aerolatus]|uniref:nitrilase-related carbon-nitrogen hydrolase n=1 Tax=Agromyces sp. LY-1074 TaxID=3074080 RepID=UPI00286281BB|nr:MULTISPECIES: nitrilase-related carbon-nitrogen hydrolase [unclassified Agromyces]MDR5700949.1 nitrilase-related carbon-nitrogen hydrolase [Agromyces sp. LY-1074]MDR5707390.1 nitrilase-related carbon-nitrogen hydrolase [Agromyces sp. LY-1358]